MTESLRMEIKNLRVKAGFALREFARKVGISPAHLSDIEHGRRLPSDEVLERIANALEGVGASFAELKKLDARFGDDLSDWVARNPEAAQLLREVKASGKSPLAVLEELRDLLSEDKKNNTARRKQ